MLVWSHERFGERAAARYQDLLKQALRDIAADPERPGSRERPELARGVRTFHLSLSRGRARGEFGIVRKPRHFLVYRVAKTWSILFGFCMTPAIWSVIC
jgi:toxin ParE1/3/4